MAPVVLLFQLLIVNNRRGMLSSVIVATGGVTEHLKCFIRNVIVGIQIKPLIAVIFRHLSTVTVSFSMPTISLLPLLQ